LQKADGTSIHNPQNIDLRDYMPTKTIAKKSPSSWTACVSAAAFRTGHTSGDLIVYLPDQKIAFTGDITVTRLPIRSFISTMQVHRQVDRSMKVIVALNAIPLCPDTVGRNRKVSCNSA